MTRTGWLAACGGALLALGAAALLRWPTSAPVLACDASDVRWVDAGGGLVARCAPELPGGERPAGPARMLGLKFDLNAVPEDDLALVSGIGPVLAHALVEARDAGHGFRTWEQVDDVHGVGPAKLRILQDVSEIRH